MTIDLTTQFLAVAAQIEAAERAAADMQDFAIDAARAGKIPWSMATDIGRLNDQWHAALQATLDLARAALPDQPCPGGE